MKKWQKAAAFAVSAALTAAAAMPAAASETAEETEGTSGAAQQAFAQAAEDFYNGLIAQSPVNLHFEESNPENPVLPDEPLGSFSVEDTEAADLFNTISGELDQISASDLTTHQRQVYNMMRAYIDEQNQLYALPDYEDTLGPMGGILGSLDTVITEYYLLNETDVQNYIKVLQDVPRFLDEVLQEVQYQASLGYGPTKYAVDSLLDDKDAKLSADNHPYLAAFTENLEESDLTDDQKTAYTAQVTDVVTNTVIPAFQSFYDALSAMETTETKPLCEMDQGKEYYALLARIQTGTDMTPDELYNYLEDKVSEDLRDLQMLYMTDYDAVTALDGYDCGVSDPDETLSQLRTFTLQDFPQIDHTNYTVSYLPDALKVQNQMAYYLSPPIDNLDRNVIRVNGDEVSPDDSVTMWTTLAHEGFPGHLYQIQYIDQNVREYPVEDLISSAGTTEGWAFYVEELSLDWTDMPTDTKKAWSLNNSLGMAISAMVDIGINYLGWDTGDMSDFLSDYYSDISQADLQDWYDSSANDPGVYLPYAVGYYQTADMISQISAAASSQEDALVRYLDYSGMTFREMEKYISTENIVEAGSGRKAS